VVCLSRVSCQAVGVPLGRGDFRQRSFAFEQEMQLINTRAGQIYSKWRCFVVCLSTQKLHRACALEPWNFQSGRASCFEWELQGKQYQAGPNIWKWRCNTVIVPVTQVRRGWSCVGLQATCDSASL
jgi:hypothetical protein